MSQFETLSKSDVPDTLGFQLPESESELILFFAGILTSVNALIAQEHQVPISDLTSQVSALAEKATAAYKQLAKNERAARHPDREQGQIPQISLTQKPLLQIIQTEYVETIEIYRSYIRGRELLQQRNWKERPRGNDAARQAWLNQLTDNLLVKAENNPELRAQMPGILEFADKRISVVIHKDKPVIFLDWDREYHPVNQESKRMALPPAMHWLIADESIQTVMIEYFSPELKANFRGKNLPSTIQDQFLTESLLQVIQAHALTQVGEKKSDAFRRRLFGFDAVARECIAAEKDVLVGDIANSFEYMIARDWFDKVSSHLPLGSVVSGLIALLGFFQQNSEISDLASDITLATVAFGILSVMRFKLQEKTIQLEPHPSEKFTPYLETARRIFLATAVEKATTLGTPLVIYPPHHNNRIIDNLTNPQPAQQLYYKLIYPYLDYSLRHYTHQANSENPSKSSNDDYSGWNLTEQIPLGIRTV